MDSLIRVSAHQGAPPHCSSQMRLCGRAQSPGRGRAGRECIAHLLPAPRTGNRSSRPSPIALLSQHRLPYTHLDISQMCSYVHRLTLAVFVFPESIDSAEGRKVLVCNRLKSTIVVFQELDLVKHRAVCVQPQGDLHMTRAYPIWAVMLPVGSCRPGQAAFTIVLQESDAAAATTATRFAPLL